MGLVLMTAYTPLFIGGNATGLVQDRENFLLPVDAYPTLENAFVWRERIKRKQGYQLLGRLRRVFTNISIGNSSASPWTFDILASQGVKGIITNISNANPGVVTTNEPHNLVTGTLVTITGVTGMTQVNGNTYSIINTGANTFSIGVDTSAYGVYVSGGLWANSAEINASVQPASVIITFGGVTFTDQGNGTLTSVTLGNSGIINYQSGVITLTTTVGAGSAATATFNYYPTLPVMGIRTRDLASINIEMTVFFDTKYAYNFTASGFVEFIPGTVWTGSNSNFFWSTNYWVSSANVKIFWVTNFSGQTGDPIRYTNGQGSGTGAWVDFAPSIGGGNFLEQCLCILPFRSRLVVFNTLEGPNLATSIQYPQRIRWSAIGTPFTVSTAPLPVSTNADAWRDDIRGQGGYIDIPTNEDIITVGFVRDNLVIYCERSTWQLRYTGRSISPFQIEKVNTELGAGSTFSAVQFDTSLVGIGDKGVVQCNSVESERIDIKIPDLIMNHVNNQNFGQKRVHGVRDFYNRLAYWTYPESDNNGIFPDRRLVYNYENDSWAIFTDSLTTLGTFQPIGSRTWGNPSGGNPLTKVTWGEANFPWGDKPSAILSIVGGNQQGYVEYLDSQTTNDESLTITAITGNTTTATEITSPNHNLQTDDVISIADIPLGTSFANTLNSPLQGLITGATQANPCQITSAGQKLVTGDSVEIEGIVGMTQLNGNVYTVTVTGTNTFTLDVNSTSFTPYVSGGIWTSQSLNIFAITKTTADTFLLRKYNSSTKTFFDPQLDPPGTYIGGGQIKVRDNFRIVSKKFNFIEQGQNIQIGYIDILMNTIEGGAITMKMYVNYDDSTPVNVGNEFFNTTISTDANSSLQTAPSNGAASSKSNQRVFCACRGNYLTIEYTFSNAQMNGEEQENDVQIDMQVVWQRPAGRIQTL